MEKRREAEDEMRRTRMFAQLKHQAIMEEQRLLKMKDELRKERQEILAKQEADAKKLEEEA